MNQFRLMKMEKLYQLFIEWKKKEAPLGASLLPRKGKQCKAEYTTEKG